MNTTALKKVITEKYSENIWSGKVIRPLSCYPTLIFLKLGITANQTTLLNIFIGLTGCAMLGLGTYKATILGAILLNVNYLLDRVDGNIARATGTTTKLGAMIDGFSDILLDMLIPVSIGIGLYLHPQFGINGNIYLLLGFMFSGFRLLRSRYAAHASTIIGGRARDVVKGRSLILKSGLALVSLEPIILLAFAVVGGLSIFLAGYTVLALCELVGFTILAIRRAWRP